MEILLGFNDFYQATQQFMEQYGGVCQTPASQETVLLIPERFGQGKLHGIHLREGLDLLIHNYQLSCDLSLDFQQFSNQNGLVNLSFCLAGQYTGSMPGFKNQLEISAGQMGLATVPNISGIVNLPKESTICVVELVIAPELAIALVDSSLQTLPTPWRQALTACASCPFYQTAQLSPKLSQALQDLLSCPYQGALRQLYLEGKSLEIIALYFANLSAQTAAKDHRLSKKDRDSLQHAQAILFDQMENPPSLAALSKQVGLSERKLQQGFRQQFGTTVFDALHDYRMEQARQLLEQDQLSVGAIAQIVGISHRGYFSTAFKRKFGSTPSTYLKALRK
ncbi:MAG: AraC family transcriptional regulator [Cyanobacteria bacterium J06643_4]